MSAPDPDLTTPDGLIIRTQNPVNLEMPFEKLNGFITPNELFYVRSHFPIPEIAAKNWRLKIEGEVESPFEVSYEDLLKLSTHTAGVTLECAGNNRNFLDPKVKGVQWGLGAVGNASWTGPLLSLLLQKARVKPSAVEVILEGADEGEIENPPKPPGKIRYARSVPLKKAMKDVVLAHTMNGETLSATHGFPVRAVVPGWYAMASVKWLERIIVTSEPFAGYYQSIDYTFWERVDDGLPSLKPLAENQIKAEIARPEKDEIISANTDYRIHGAAWSSDAEITSVEISTDNGKSWSAARLGQESIHNSWRLWEFKWKTPSTPGPCTLMARATDSRGRAQSFDRSADRGTYMINHILPIPVEIR